MSVRIIYRRHLADAYIFLQFIFVFSRVSCYNEEFIRAIDSISSDKRPLYGQMTPLNVNVELNTYCLRDLSKGKEASQRGANRSFFNRPIIVMRR